MSVLDQAKLLCSGTISYFDLETQSTKQSAITYPCGSRIEDLIAGSSSVQMPFRYQLMVQRAAASTCCFWRANQDSEEDAFKFNKKLYEPQIFEYTNVVVPTGVLSHITVDAGRATEKLIPNPDLNVIGGWKHEDRPSFVVDPRVFKTILINGATEVPTRCVNAKARIWNQGLDDVPPCNGSKTECPFYTGPKFQYLQDENFAPGQTVLGQSIQELRDVSFDWLQLDNPQKSWESIFDLPYLWGRDNADQPTAISNDDPFLLEATVYTILTRIYWDVQNSEAILSKFPSADSGTPQEDIGRLEPPNFPTIVKALDYNEIFNLKVTFPNAGVQVNQILRKSKTTDYEKERKKKVAPFIYQAFDKDDTRLYLAGLSLVDNYVFIVNKSILTSFPDIENDPVDSKELSVTIRKLIVQTLAMENGAFAYVKANEARFWDLKTGIDLKVNAENKIFILTEIEGDWFSVSVNVNHQFYHVELIQKDVKTTLPIPQTNTLLTRLGSAPVNQVKFTGILLSINELEIANVYHYYILDKSLSRLQGDSGVPNTRYWKVKKTSSKITARYFSQAATWRKFDNCSKFIIEIKAPTIPHSVPRGLNRSFDVSNINFLVKQEPGTSSHGQQQDTKVSMKVVEDFGRSLNGKKLPARFFIIEPEADNLVFKEPDKLKATVSFDLDIYTAINSDVDAKDILPDKLADIGDLSQFDYAGVLTPKPLASDALGIDPHSITKDGIDFIVSNPKKYNLSYVVEFKVKGTDFVIGNKWVGGVVEIPEFWCRDIDIIYAWQANQEFKRLLPDHNKAIVDLITNSRLPVDVLGGQDSDFTSQTSAVYKPKCGDHEISFVKQGPMFSPYDDCERSAVIQDDLGISINFRIPYTNGITDERYRGPDLLSPRIYHHSAFGSLFSSCFFEFSLGSFYRYGSKWNGSARIRGPISKNFDTLKAALFQSQGWRLPQFGNIGRDHLRINRYMHFSQFIYMSSNGPKIGLGWLPLFPHASSTGVFDRTTPRSLISYTVDSTLDSSAINLDSYEQTKSLLALRTTGEAPQISPINTPNESFKFERKKFKDTYRLKRIRTKDGVGTTWPQTGFYLNFKSLDVVWAHPELTLGIARDQAKTSPNYLKTTNFITGVKLSNPSTSVSGSLDYPEERFNRPVFTGLEEGEHELRIKNPHFNSDGTVDSYASIYIDSKLPLYFDRFTGEIQDKKNSLTSDLEKELNTVSDLDALKVYRDNKNIPVPVEYLFDANESLHLPDSIDKLDSFVNKGNLYKDAKVKFYSTAGLAGPLDDDDIEWVGYLPAIKVDSILPKYLPKREVNYTYGTASFDNMNPKLKYSAYPGNGSTRHSKSNINLFDAGEQFFVNAPSDSNVVEWKNYNQADLDLGPPPSGTVDLRAGYIGQVVLEIAFTYPVELGSIKFSTQTYRKDPGGDEIVVHTEPAFKLEYTDLTSSHVLIDKPEFNLPGFQETSIKRNFEFKHNPDKEFDEVLITQINSKEVSHSYNIDEIIITSLKVTIGARKDSYGFKLGKIVLGGLTLNEGCSEKVLSIEPSYMITTGYTVENDRLSQWAQDPLKLVGPNANFDSPDDIDGGGVAEFWRPGDLNEERTGCRGKLRRHWTNKFDSLDTESFFRNQPAKQDVHYFLDLTVEQSEQRQRNLIQKAIDNITQDSSYMFDNSNRIFINPYDRFALEDIGFNTAKLSQNNVQFTVDDLLELNDLVSKVNLQPGWQDPGFSACLNPDTHIAQCISALGRTPHVAYRNDQGICRGNSGVGGEVFRLFDLGLVKRSDQFDAAGSNAAGVVETENTSLPSQLMNKNADLINEQSIINNTEAYKNLNKRYRD